MRLLFGLAFLVNSVCLAASPGTRESYIYDEIMSGQSLEILPQRESLGIGESVSRASYCGADSEFVCFESESYAFAARRSAPCSAGSWTVHGRKYSVSEPLHERYLLGKIQKVCAIQSSLTRGSEKISARYLYSPAEGLLIMEFREFSGDIEQPIRSYLARDRGFGAAGR